MSRGRPAVLDRMHPAWLVVSVGFVAIALTFGSRFSLGLYLPFLPEALHSKPAAVSSAIGLGMLSAGVVQPFVGLLADRWGARNVLVLGLVAGGMTFVGMAMATALWQLALLMGVTGGITFACVNPVIMNALVARWFETQRGRAMGVVTSGSKLGMVALLPLVSAAIALMGWRATLGLLGALIWLLVPVVWLLVRSSPAELGLRAYGAEAEAPSAGPEPGSDAAVPPRVESGLTLRRALATLPFWLLALCFLGNGFTINIVLVHLPSYFLEHGYGQTLAASALVILGGVGLFGTVMVGMLGDRFGSLLVLILLYIARGLATLLLVMWPVPAVLGVFIVVFGLLGYGALAVMGPLLTQVFGRRSIAAIMGALFTFHQLGGAIGISAGGLSFQETGGYEAGLWVAVVTCAVSAVCIWWVARFSLDDDAGTGSPADTARPGPGLAQPG